MPAKVGGLFVSAWDEDEHGVTAPKNPHDTTEQVLTAAEHGDIRALDAFITANAALVSARDADGYTPLHRAAYSDHAAVVARLLQLGGDPRARTDDDWTPLHCAACWANAKVAQVGMADSHESVCRCSSPTRAPT